MLVMAHMLRLKLHKRKKWLHLCLVIWNTKNYNHHQIYQTFVASKMRLRKIKEILSSIKCKNSARWALFLISLN